MPDRCERDCGRRGIALWWHPDHNLELLLCGPHTDHHAEALVAQDWALMVDQRVETLAPTEATTR